MASDGRIYVDVNGECCEECGAVHDDGRPYLYPDGETFILRCLPCLVVAAPDVARSVLSTLQEARNGA